MTDAEIDHSLTRTFTLGVRSDSYQEFWGKQMPTVEKGDVRLHYEQTGPVDSPVLILGNSLGSNLHMWDKVLPFFENSFRVLRYDMRGHGKSSVPPPPYSIEQLGNDLLMLMDHLSIGRAHLCGLSLGGLVSMWLGIHAPERFHRMIFANTAARLGTRDGWEQRMAMVQSSGMDGLASQTLERWITPAYREQHPAEMETIRQMVAATNPTGYCGCCAALRDTDLRDEIATIEAPCLVISGTHDPVTPPADGRAIHSVVRNSSYLELDSAHLSAWEKADEFAGAVVAFTRTNDKNDGSA